MNCKNCLFFNHNTAILKKDNISKPGKGVRGWGWTLDTLGSYKQIKLTSESQVISSNTKSQCTLVLGSVAPLGIFLSTHNPLAWNNVELSIFQYHLVRHVFICFKVLMWLFKNVRSLTYFNMNALKDSIFHYSKCWLSRRSYKSFAIQWLLFSSGLILSVSVNI